MLEFEFEEMAGDFYEGLGVSGLGYDNSTDLTSDRRELPESESPPTLTGGRDQVDTSGTSNSHSATLALAEAVQPSSGTLSIRLLSPADSSHEPSTEQDTTAPTKGRKRPRNGPKGSHGKKPGRAGSMLCGPCRLAKRGNAAPCIRNPHRRGVPCNPCKKKGFSAVQCGVRRKGPNGPEESFDTEPDTAVDTTALAPQISRSVMQEYRILSDPVHEPVRPQRQMERQYADSSSEPDLTQLWDASRPGHGLDQRNLLSQPEVEAQRYQAQPPLPLAIHLDPGRTIWAPARPAGPMYMQQTDRGLGLTAAARIVWANEIQAGLLAAGEHPLMVMQVVAPLRRQHPGR